MNQLSWLLYLAEVAGTLRGIAGTALLACVPATIAAVILWLTHDPAGHVYSFEDEDAVKKNRIAVRAHIVSALKRLPLVAIAAALIFLLTPTRNTLYAIAASEMGEQVATSATAQKALKAIDAWLDRQIAGQSAQ